MIKGVLFDMDGVLFNTERIYVRCEYQVAKRLGMAMSKEYPTTFCGMNAKNIIKKLKKDFGEELDAENYLQICRQETFAHIEKNGLEVMPHVKSSLVWLKENGIKIAVASSTKTQTVKKFLKMASLSQYFDAIVGGDQVKNGKPAPDIFVYAAKQLGLLPGQCAAVEDSHNGVRSAFAAGCVSIMVPDILPANDEMREKTAAILDDLSFLPEFLKLNLA